MDKIIVTVLLIIAGITTAFAVFNSVYPAVERSGQSISSAADDISNRITTRIEIIQAGATNTSVDVWVKNVASSRITGIEGSTIFFYGEQGEISTIPFGNEASPPPYWSYQLEGNNTQWSQTVLNRITIHPAGLLQPGVYKFQISLWNGVSAETSFSLK